MKCNNCYDTGIMCVQSGPDDFSWEECCVCHKEPKDYGLTEEEAKVKLGQNSPDPDED